MNTQNTECICKKLSRFLNRIRLHIWEMRGIPIVIFHTNTMKTSWPLTPIQTDSLNKYELKLNALSFIIGLNIIIVFEFCWNFNFNLLHQRQLLDHWCSDSFVKRVYSQSSESAIWLIPALSYSVIRSVRQTPKSPMNGKCVGVSRRLGLYL